MVAQVEGFHLSPQQRFLYASGEEQRMNQCEVSLTGRLDVLTLQNAIQKTVDRHEILRTTFHRLPGMSIPLQRVERDSAISFTAYDIRHLNGQEQEAEFRLISEREAEPPIDLQSGPVLCACLVSRLPEVHTLILTLPALCADRRSLENVLREISTLYNAAGDGPLLEEPIQYADAASMLNQFAEADPSEPGKRFWSRQEVGKYLDSPIPYQAGTLLEAPHAQRSVDIEISSQLVEKLDSACSRLEMSREVFLLSCWQILFARLGGELRFSTGVTFDGRADEAVSDAVGPYEKRLPFITELQPGMSVKEVLLATNCMIENLITWQDDFCCEQFDLDAGIQLPGVTFGWCFDYYSRLNIAADGPLSFKLTELISEADRFKVLLSIVESGPKLSAQLQYDPSNFEPEDMKRLSEQFQTLLADAIENPDTGIIELKVLPDSERAFLLKELNITERDYAIDCCAHHLFERQVRRNPEALAVVFNDQNFSYAELNAKSNQLARKLQKLGVGPEVKVGLCTQRTPETLVGILGILKAGGAYVPLDPVLPSQRLGYMLQDSQSQVLVTRKGIELNFPQVEIPSIYLDSDGSEIKEESADDLSSEARPSNLAYVIYTSGSTGKPKGVAIEHRQLVNYVLASRERIGFDAHSFALLSTVAADLGNTSLFGALCAGGSLHLISHEVALDGKELAAYFRQHPIDCVKITPSHLAGLITSGAADILPNLRLVLGGEASDWASAKELQEFKPDCSIFNHYGPTETTIGCCLYSVPRSENRSGLVPIGNPLSNIHLYVLDQEGQPVPLKVAGELYIGGAGVGRGYLNKPALTAERYVPDGFSGREGDRLYRTGDVVRWSREGEMEFIGRRDNQVKIRGHRVELGEVEAAVSTCPGVAQAAVLVEGDGAQTRLVAYIVQKEGTLVDVKQWQVQLRALLPQHMVPDQMIELEQMPLLPNGKIDRKALPRRESARQKTRAKEKQLLDRTELQLIQVWEEVLCVQCIDITDNFFELGGNSLAAVSLCARLRKIYGAQISVRMVFDAPTVESMSVLVRQNISLSPPSSVVPINPHGEKLPFFCMHAAGGIPHSYIPLAYGLGPDQPFYALQSYGLDLGQEPLSTVEDMAAVYIKDIRNVQSAGPYQIGGWSFGVPVSFEIAQQLTAMGEEVRLLVLMDSPRNCNPADSTLSEEELREVEQSFLAEYMQEELGLAVESLTFDQQVLLYMNTLKESGMLPADITQEQIRRYLRVTVLNKHAARLYQPKPYSGRVTLFKSSFSRHENYSYGWEELALGGIDVFNFDSSHADFVSKSNAPLVAERLRRCFETVAR